jgi:hypothetical protein
MPLSFNKGNQIQIEKSEDNRQSLTKAHKSWSNDYE